MLACAGDTPMALTALFTWTAAFPAAPPLVAVTVLPPALNGVTRPDAGSTLATRGAELLHVNGMPGMAWPLPSRAVALNCWRGPGQPGPGPPRARSAAGAT